MSYGSPICKDELTLSERAEIEQQYDGPIPPQAIADKIAARHALSRPEILARISEIAASIDFYLKSVGTERSDYMRRYDLSRIDALMKEQKRLDDMLDATRLAAE